MQITNRLQIQIKYRYGAIRQRSFLYLHKRDRPIKAVLIKNPVPQNNNYMKTLDNFVKYILKDKK